MSPKRRRIQRPGPAEQPTTGGAKTAFSTLRSEMVENAIVARGVRSENVLGAMRSVPREAFLPRQLQEFAYEDSPLPIDEGQTISQPYIVAFMTEALALEGGERVLEIGTGSGYAAAVLAEIAGEVYTVERIGALAEKAASTLADLGYDNVHVLHDDGTNGWPEHAPYDGIIVAAGGPKVPESLKAAAQDRRPARHPGGHAIPAFRNWFASRASRRTNTGRRTSRTCGSFRWSAVRDGLRRSRGNCASAAATAGRACAERDIGGSVAAVRAVRLHRECAARSTARSHRRRQDRPARRGEPWDLGILSDARAHHARIDQRRRAFASSPSRATGRMRRASITTCGISSIRPPNGRLSLASRSGCGATTRSAPSSIGCARTMLRSRPARGSPFTGSISTVSTTPSVRC